MPIPTRLANDGWWLCERPENRSNDWLIRMNLITLTATLYFCSLINFVTPLIADSTMSATAAKPSARASGST